MKISVANTNDPLKSIVAANSDPLFSDVESDEFIPKFHSEESPQGPSTTVPPYSVEAALVPFVVYKQKFHKFKPIRSLAPGDSIHGEELIVDDPGV